MATRPAVAGLLKHQLYFRDPHTGREQNIVMTFWTWKNEDPVAGARVTYEQGAIKAWAQTSTFRAWLADDTWATWIKSWDFGQTPPSRFAPFRIWPVSAGQSSDNWAANLSVVIALRTQAVGSDVRNRQNGRLHHPLGLTSNLTNGLWSSGIRNGLQTAYHALRDVLKPAANANSGTWVVPCFFLDGAPRPGGPLLPAVNHVIARPEPGVTRSRLYHPGPYSRGT